jgi:hypothetical protein
MTWILGAGAINVHERPLTYACLNACLYLALPQKRQTEAAQEASSAHSMPLFQQRPMLFAKNERSRQGSMGPWLAAEAAQLQAAQLRATL